MLKAIKGFYWDIKDKSFRFYFLNDILGCIPGRAGFHLRRKHLPKFFESVGDEIHIFESVRFRGAHKLRVGDRVHIGVGCFIQAEGGVELADDVILGPGVKIWSMNHVFDDPDKTVMEQGYTFKSVKIGRDVWVGANVFIMPGADIGEGSVISAGAVVGGKQVAPYSILAGNPARKIGTRKKEQDENGDAAGSAGKESGAKAP